MSENPKVHDPNFWRYQSLLEACADRIIRNSDIIKDRESLVWSLAHVAKRIYEMGLRGGIERGRFEALEVPELTIIEVEMAGHNVCIKTRDTFN